MAREITYNDAIVGYNFEKSQYYVTNKDTTITRPVPINVNNEQLTNIASQVFNLFKVVAPSVPAGTATTAKVKALYTMEETLNEIYYTWEDTGAYIKTIQLNTYDTHPVTIDLIQEKLYIMNSDLIFDLKLNEDTSYRVAYLIDYFKRIVGLTVTQEQMTSIYNELLHFYSPYFIPYDHANYYAVIQPRADIQEPLYYTNYIRLSNYNHIAPLTFTLHYNPNNDYSANQHISNILHIDPNTRTIQTLNDIPSTLQPQDTIRITNSTQNNNSYSADGTYTVSAVSGKTLTVTENIPVAYDIQYLPCYKVVAKTTVTSVQRENFTITCSAPVSNDIIIGDTIHLKGTTPSADGTTADGTYTVTNILGSTIVVQEEIPINYTGSTAFIYKQVQVGNISFITSNQVNLYEAPSPSITSTDQVTIRDIVYTVSAYSNKVITLTSSPAYYVQSYAELNIPKQATLTNITIENSTLTNIGNESFTVNTYGQAQDYITEVCTECSMDTFVYALPENLEAQMSSRVATSGAITINGIVGQCKGLYTEVYTDVISAS